MGCKMYRNKAGMKTQEDYTATENCGKERLEDYYATDVVFQSFFIAIFL